MSNAQSAKGNPASKRMMNPKLKAKRAANKAKNERLRDAGTHPKQLRNEENLRAAKWNQTRLEDGMTVKEHKLLAKKRAQKPLAKPACQKPNKKCFFETILTYPLFSQISKGYIEESLCRFCGKRKKRIHIEKTEKKENN